MSSPVSLADRQLARDTVALLTSIAERIRAGHVPRWCLVSIAAPLQMIHHTVTRVEENKRRFASHECGASCGVQKEGSR